MKTDKSKSTQFNINTLADTEQLASKLAQHCHAPMLIYLEGDLGAGKTTLVRFFMSACGYQGLVKSPTYTLVETYRFTQYNVYHFDLYRLRDPQELYYMGLDDYMGSDSIVLIEWPEKGQEVIPPADLRIQIEHEGDRRQFTLLAQSLVGTEVLNALET